MRHQGNSHAKLIVAGLLTVAVVGSVGELHARDNRSGGGKRSSGSDVVVERAMKLVARATSDLGKGLGRVVDAQTPANSDRTVELAEEARELLEASVKGYDTAYLQLQSKYKKMPIFIPDTTAKDRRLQQEKNKLFSQYIEARFQAFVVRFYLADSYRSIPLPASAGRRLRNEWDEMFEESLREAQTGFRDIYIEYRRQLVGLFAHLWVARCLAAQGDHRRALGIYEVLGEHENDALKPFQRQVFHFRLVSLVAQGENLLVATEAEEWLLKNAAHKGEAAYGGVQLELAGAYVTLGKEAERRRQRDKYFRTAHSLLEELATGSGTYAAAAKREKSKLETLRKDNP